MYHQKKFQKFLKIFLKKSHFWGFKKPQNGAKECLEGVKTPKKVILQKILRLYTNFKKNR